MPDMLLPGCFFRLVPRSAVRDQRGRCQTTSDGLGSAPLPRRGFAAMCSAALWTKETRELAPEHGHEPIDVGTLESSKH